MSNWKSLPISLKILFIVLLLWAVMSLGVLVTSPEREIAFFGFLLQGTSSAMVIVLLDFISPLLFLYALWKKLKWGAHFGLFYNGVFIVNSIVALFTVKDVFGNAIYYPLIASMIFFGVIFKERKYFS